MMVDRIISNGRVFVGGEFHELDIAVGNEKIQAVGLRGAFQGLNAQNRDADGMLVFPGVIDSHFHCRAPSRPDREDFTSATTAAAAGGVTTIIEMPISEPPTTNGHRLSDRASLAESEGIVDVGFYASCGTLDLKDLESSRDAGALAFKGFLQQIPPGRESEFDGLCLPTTRELLRAFQLLQEFELPCVFHAEDEPMLQLLQGQLRADGKNDGAAHADHRPDFVEATSVSTLLLLAERFGVHVNVPHVSSRMTVNVIREAKARGVPVTAETCPQYLQFDRHTLEELGPYGKCNPPLKEPHDTEALWEALQDKTIDTVASDHSPFTRDEKESARDDVWSAPPGFPGVEVLAPYLIGAAMQSRISFTRLNELLWVNPSRIFGLYGTKGEIRAGADADLMLFNPLASGVFDHTSFLSKARDIGVIWDGIPRSGAVVETLLRGETVYREGEILAQAGSGRHVRRGKDK